MLDVICGADARGLVVKVGFLQQVRSSASWQASKGNEQPPVRQALGYELPERSFLLRLCWRTVAQTYGKAYIFFTV
jgi:hypothetical protein